MPQLFHVGGNGHTAARLAPVLAALESAGRPFVLRDIKLPGFEGRRASEDLDGLIRAVAEGTETYSPGDRLYASGIGALLVLAARSRGGLVGVSIVLQAPVLAGLKYRRFPRLMRFAPVRWLIQGLFRRDAFRSYFAGKYFESRLDPALQAAFFDGYGECEAFAKLFEWIGPAWVDALLRAFREAPDLLEGVSIWWGERDRVVGLTELRVTESELGRSFPLRLFERWGHYPMLDVPEEWVEAMTEEWVG